MATDFLNISPMLTLEELAAFLKRPKNTLLNDRARNPAALPPAFKIPGTRHILFRVQDIEAWVAAGLVGADERSVEPKSLMPTPPAIGKRRGRPRKPT